MLPKNIQKSQKKKPSASWIGGTCPCAWLLYVMSEALTLASFVPMLLLNQNTHIVTTTFNIFEIAVNVPKEVARVKVPDNTQYCLLYKPQENVLCPITQNKSVIDSIEQLGSRLFFFTMGGDVGGSSGPGAILEGQISNGYVTLTLTVKYATPCYLDSSDSIARTCAIICITS